MKKFKRIMALVIALAMVVAMALPAMAAITQEPTEGSITIKSPVMGASYEGYRVFDMTMSEDGTSFAYTIANTNPFYGTVNTYATDPANGITLTQAVGAADGVYNITVDENKFDAQKFGQALEAALVGSPAVPDDPDTPDDESQPAVPGINASSVKYTPNYESGKSVITLATSDEIVFGKETVGEETIGTALPLGYYLIIGTYPSATGTVTVGTGENAFTLTNEDFDAADYETRLENAVNTYVDATVTPDYIASKITESHATNKNGDPLTSGDVEEYAKFVADLKADLKADTLAKIEEAKAKYDALESDINVQSQRLVFIDSTTPDAEIIEKNEIDKWDVPANPDGHATAEGVPEHGEPEGGKNIVVGYMDSPNNTKPIYSDWTEANIGDSINYQIRINAMNFVRDDSYTAADDLANEDTQENNTKVNQVKEYVIGDYQKDGLTFDPAKDKILVKIVDESGNVVKIDDAEQSWDYTTWYNNFFIPQNKVTFATAGNPETAVNGILDNGGGIVIPWVGVTTDKTEAEKHVNYTTNYEPVLDNNGQPVMEQALDADGQPIYEVAKNDNGDVIYIYTLNGTLVKEGTAAEAPTTPGAYDTRTTKMVQKMVAKTTPYYFYSLYDSDVTIVVDYSMTLNDKAVIDNPGNINYSQYGMNWVEPDDYKYEPQSPTEEHPDWPDKPDEDRDVDTATVYTYALAIQKVDEQGKNLAGATFTVKGLTVEQMSEGYYKVASYNASSNDESAELVSDKNGLLVIEGLMASIELTVTEAKAPDGYNLLTASVPMKATKVGSEVTTTSTTTYFDAEGNPTTKELAATRVTEYSNAAGARIAKKVLNSDGTVSYFGGTDTATLTESGFNDAISGITTTEFSAEVVSANLTPYAFKVENKKGTELPSTGGIGTTIFYVVGAILVIGAGVVLITRRRMDG